VNAPLCDLLIASGYAVPASDEIAEAPSARGVTEAAAAPPIHKVNDRSRGRRNRRKN
jgi:hypothetical protein